MEITITEDSTPHWIPQDRYGIDISRIGKIVSKTWWENACLKDIEMLNNDGPYLWMKFKEGHIIDFALANLKDKDIIAFLKNIKKEKEIANT